MTDPAIFAELGHGSLVRRLEELRRRYERDLLSVPGVTAVGVSHRRRGGRSTDEPVLAVSVARKLGCGGLAGTVDVARCFSALRGRVDVVERRFAALSVQGTSAPGARSPSTALAQAAGVATGGAVANARSVSRPGTIGAILTDEKSGDPRILSAWHVLAGGNKKAKDAATSGNKRDEVVLPGAVPTTIGELEYTGYGGALDVASAKLTTSTHVEVGELPGGRSIAAEPRDLGREPMRRGESCWKFGAATGWTTGFVVSTNHSVSYVANPRTNFRLRLTGTILLEAHVDADGRKKEISRGGDSGSLVVDDDLRPVGIVVAGDADSDFMQEFAVLSPIIPALDWLGLKL